MGTIEKAEITGVSPDELNRYEPQWNGIVQTFNEQQIPLGQVLSYLGTMAIDKTLPDQIRYISLQHLFQYQRQELPYEYKLQDNDIPLTSFSSSLADYLPLNKMTDEAFIWCADIMGNNLQEYREKNGVDGPISNTYQEYFRELMAHVPMNSLTGEYLIGSYYSHILNPKKDKETRCKQILVDSNIPLPYRKIMYKFLQQQIQTELYNSNDVTERKNFPYLRATVQSVMDELNNLRSEKPDAKEFIRNQIYKIISVLNRSRNQKNDSATDILEKELSHRRYDRLLQLDLPLEAYRTIIRIQIDRSTFLVNDQEQEDLANHLIAHILIEDNDSVHRNALNEMIQQRRSALASKIKEQSAKHTAFQAALDSIRSQPLSP